MRPHFGRWRRRLAHRIPLFHERAASVRRVDPAGAVEAISVARPAFLPVGALDAHPPSGAGGVIGCLLLLGDLIPMNVVGSAVRPTQHFTSAPQVADSLALAIEPVYDVADMKRFFAANVSGDFLLCAHHPAHGS